MVAKAYDVARRAHKGYVAGPDGKARMWFEDTTLSNIWPKIVATINKNKDKPFTESFKEIPVSGVANISFRGAFYCPTNKCVYMMPSTFDKVLKLNTLDDTYTFLPIPYDPTVVTDNVERFATARYYKGFGYFLVANNQKLLEIDCSNDSMQFWPGSRMLRISNLGCAVADSGYMYSAPVSSTFYLKTDLDNRFYNVVKLPKGMAAEMIDEWSGIVLAPNGVMYTPPENGDSILRLDTHTDVVTKMLGSGPIDGRYRNGVITANGCIYFMPYLSGNILKLDTKTEVYSEIPFGSTGSFWSQSGVLIPNGHIYVAPWQGDKIKRLNPDNDSFTDVFNVTPNVFKWGKCIETPQGVYLCPTNFEKIGKITITADWEPFEDIVYESGYISS